MITKEILKAEIDHIRDEYLEILYKIIKALESPTEAESHQTTSTEINEESEWHNFIQETYGSLAKFPIERGEQGIYEARETIE